MTKQTNVLWNQRRGIYAIADADASERAGLAVVDVARATLAGGAVAVQLRAKDRGADLVERELDEILKSASPSERRLLVVNDRADLAELAGVSTVHLGQDDLPPSSVKVAFPKLCVGLSTHNLRQFDAALECQGLAYAALGPIYCTESKRNADPVVGVELLSVCHQKARAQRLPLVAIGGISLERISGVARHAEMIAGIGLLMPEPGTNHPYSWIEKRTQEVQSLITGVQLQS